MRPDRAQVLNDAPLDDLMVVLLRQYKRLLQQHHIELTEAEIKGLAARIVARDITGDRVTAIRAALVRLIRESEQVLQRWNLTYAESLKTEMAEIPGWESTAEFLEIANEKGNAELRIASGAVLVTALGDTTYAPYLLQTLIHNPDDVDGVTARRVLLLVSGVDPAAPDWLDQVGAWLAEPDSPNAQADKTS